MASHIFVMSRNSLRVSFQRHHLYSTALSKTLTRSRAYGDWTHEHDPCVHAMSSSSSQGPPNQMSAAQLREEWSKKSRGRPSLLSFVGVIVLAFMPITCGALGWWQVQRLKWKEELIEDVHDKLQRAPIVLPRNVNIAELPNFEYRKVTLSGVWDHAHAILLGPKSRENVKGYQVVTPLLRPGGASTILVNRGFISAEVLKNHPELLTRAQEVVELLGLLRCSQLKNMFTPDNNPETGDWYWVDVDGIAEHAGGLANAVQPVYVEAVFDGNSGEAAQMLAHGEPIGRSSQIELRNMHRTYAVTWFSLAAVTGVLFYRLGPLKFRARMKMLSNEINGPRKSSLAQQSSKPSPTQSPAAP